MRPRIRTIKPEIWQDEKVGALSHGARLLFVGLITMADDEGRLRELPAAILGHVFPWDEIPVGKLAKWLAELGESGAILRYTAGGCRYAAITHWFRHQRVDKPNPSELPIPPEDGSQSSRDYVCEQIAAQSKINLGKDQEKSRPPRARASGTGTDPDPDPDRSSDHARELFAYWQERCHHPQAKFTDERRDKVLARLRQGYTPEQIRQGVDGAAVNPPRDRESGVVHDDLVSVCRNGAQLERYMARAEAQVVPMPQRSRTAEIIAERNGWERGYPDEEEAS